MPLPAGSIATFRFGDMSAPVRVPATAGEAVTSHLYRSRGTFTVDITVHTAAGALWGRRRLMFHSTRAGVPEDIPTDPDPEP